MAVHPLPRIGSSISLPLPIDLPSQAPIVFRQSDGYHMADQKHESAVALPDIYIAISLQS
jgi:hypothetical protein